MADDTQVTDDQVDDSTSMADTIDDLVDGALNKVKTKKSKDDDEVAESNKVADSLLSLQNLIERNANELDRLKSAQKELRESLKNIFENDSALAESERLAQEMTQQLKERKNSLDNTPEVKQLKIKLTDLKEEMKEIEETLNNHLINLFQMTGSSSFDTSDGDQREFSVRAKVKPKKAKAE